MLLMCNTLRNLISPSTGKMRSPLTLSIYFSFSTENSSAWPQAWPSALQILRRLASLLQIIPGRIKDTRSSREQKRNGDLEEDGAITNN
mmetsp:Transcript_26831/g.41948  ORF Transcript_26831/g.41948 Transcript_26831/m.41948 type:complete len:89 (-) Transcript_26831:197-463(-)